MVSVKVSMSKQGIGNIKDHKEEDAQPEPCEEITECY